MAKNELWFYSGVRYAKDGRYACYCDTPAKKRTVLLKNALVTLSRANGTANEATPWNIRQNEIRVEWNDVSAVNARAFQNSNYLIVHDMATGGYYCYYVDYIDTVQQFTNYSEGAIADLKAIGSQIIYRIGISLDYWQTFFFKMQNKFTSAADKPVYAAPHSSASDTINEVVMPQFDFMNVVRTNMKPILSDNYWLSQFPEVEATLMSPNQKNSVVCDLLSFALSNNDNLYPEMDSQGYGEYVIALQIELVRNRQDGVKRETMFIWSNDGFHKVYENPSTPLDSGYILKIITRANIFCISQGTFTPKFVEHHFTAPDGSSEYYNFGSTAGIKYNVINAWILPKPIVYKCVPKNYRETIGTFGSIRPLNTNLDFPVYTFPHFNVLKSRYQGVSPSQKAIKFANTFNGVTITSDHLEQFFTALSAPDGGNGTIKHEALKACAFIGNNNQQIKLAGEIETVKQTGSYALCPVFHCVELKAYIYCDGITLNYIVASQYQQINIIDRCKIPLRNVVDNEEIARAKEREEAQKQNDILSLITTGVGFGVSLFTGNIGGAVMSGAQLATQSARVANAHNITTDYDKLRNSATTPAIVDAILNGSLLVNIPTYNNGVIDGAVTPPTFANNWINKFTEIGATVNVQINNIHRNINSDYAYRLQDLFAPQAVDTGYIEAGMLLLNIPAEVGEVLEKRFREGVNFYYV